jgi:hypothetical protein
MLQAEVGDARPGVLRECETLRRRTAHGVSSGSNGTNGQNIGIRWRFVGAVKHAALVPVHDSAILCCTDGSDRCRGTRAQPRHRP